MAYTHVLITRPEAEAAKLAEMLSDSGLVPVVLPAYRFEPQFPGFDFTGAWRPGRRRLAVFTSTRAVEFGLRQLPAGFLDGVQLAAIGPATADALEGAGHSVSMLPEGGFTSEALLEHPELAREPGVAVIFAAPGGRVKLAQGLAALGWDVRMAYVYCRVDLDLPPEPVAALESAGRIISAWTSTSAMQSLKDKLPAAAWKKICQGECVVTSQRLKARLAAAGAGTVHVSGGPGNEAIAECILQLI